MPDFQLLLGPLLGFLFTAGTLLFVALNAHRTVPQAAAEAPAPAGEAPAAASEATPSESGREAP